MECLGRFTKVIDDAIIEALSCVQNYTSYVIVMVVARIVGFIFLVDENNFTRL